MQSVFLPSHQVCGKVPFCKSQARPDGSPKTVEGTWGWREGGRGCLAPSFTFNVRLLIISFSLASYYNGLLKTDACVDWRGHSK